VIPLQAIARRCSNLVSGDSFAVRQEGLDYNCPLTPAKRRNLAMQMVNRYFLRYAEIALPSTLHVGVTTACNLHCPACPTGTVALGRRVEHLDFDVYRRAVDELRDALLFALFWDWGEPLLHPRLADMIAHAGGYGVRTVVSTNGNAGTPARLRELVSARPTVVIVCIDGADQATYERYRAGGSLAKAIATVGTLQRAKEEQNSLYPVIEFRSLATRDNERQMAELLQMAVDSGADLFSVKSLRPYDYRGSNVDEVLVPLDEALSRYRYSEAEERQAKKRLDFVRRGPLRCAKPHYAPTLNSDGELVFCSYATHRLERFGDISREGFLRVWRSRSAREARLRFMRRGGGDSCVTCYFRSDHRPSILHQVPLRALPAGVTPVWPETRQEFLAAVANPRPE